MLKFLNQINSQKDFLFIFSIGCFFLLSLYLVKKIKYYSKTKIYLILLIGFYTIISMFRLGSHKFPTTTWQPVSPQQEIIFELKNKYHFDAIYLIYGEGNNNENLNDYQVGIHHMNIYGSQDAKHWEMISVIDKGSIYQYQIIKGDYNFRYVKLALQSMNDTISEFALKSYQKDEFLTLQLQAETHSNKKYPATLLIDESEKLVIYPSYFDEGFFDEIYHPRNAWEIANQQYMYPSVHPLLGTTLMALSIHFWGMNPFGWRFASALFGILILPIFFLILQKLFHNDELSLIGTALVISDFMHLTTSRIGTLEPFSVFFILLMYYYMISYYQMNYQTTTFHKQALTLLASGIFMGIGIAVKWTACYSAMGLAIIFFIHMFQEYYQILKMDKNQTRYIWKHITKTFIICIFSFIIVPIFIYLISYLPTMVWRDGYSIQNVWKQVQYMYHYHTTLTATHPYQSVWYEWIFDLRPIWYYGRETINNGYQTIACFSNPALTWIGIIAIIYTMIHAIYMKADTAIIISVGYLSALLPWIILVKRCVFAYHFYPTSFFMILSICYMFHQFFIQKYKKYILGYLFFCMLLLFLFYPVLTGIETTTNYVKLLEWLPGWYFG